ncbi:MAG: competence/damage-inducible protein A [Nitrospinae bacterium]|nr:competence/damage-inducible protein A [Nitrospinota bacterium]
MFRKEAGIPRAEIVVIGNEVTSGLVRDSNSGEIGARLLAVGVDVSRSAAVGDDEEQIVDAVRQAMGRVDVVVVTGGLGATHDDITKRVLAGLFRSGFRSDPAVRETVEGIFRARGMEAPGNALTQCEVPDNARILYNEKGTAPGLMFEKDGKRVYALPGVPLEMRHLLEKYVLPDMAQIGGGMKTESRVLWTTGISESGLWEKIGPADPLERHAEVASLPSHLGVRIRLSAWGESLDEVRARLDAAEKILREKADEYIFARDGETMEGAVGELLRRKKLTLAVAESCTGGLIGHRLTNVPGSSDYFLEGAAVYGNRAKENRLGVDPDLLSKHGAVSREAALSMAEGIRRTAGADIGLAVTGIAGPTGGSETKPAGLTFIAVNDAQGAQCEKFLFHQDRVLNKERAAQAALNLLRLWLLRK